MLQRTNIAHAQQNARKFGFESHNSVQTYNQILVLLIAKTLRTAKNDKETNKQNNVDDHETRNC